MSPLKRFAEEVKQLCRSESFRRENSPWRLDFMYAEIDRLLSQAEERQPTYIDHAAPVANAVVVINDQGEQVYRVYTGQGGSIAAYDELRQRLLDLAEGARSKAALLASKSPTSVYTNPVEVLRALAKEAEEGLGERPALEIQRMLVISTAHLPVSDREWLDRQVQHRLDPVPARPGDQQLIVDPIGEWGYRICLEKTATEGYLTAYPTNEDPLAHLLRFAIEQGCDWLALDRDGDEVDGLPTYED